MINFKIIVPALISVVCFILVYNYVAREITGTIGCISTVIVLIQLAQRYIFKPKNKRT